MNGMESTKSIYFVSQVIFQFFKSLGSEQVTSPLEYGVPKDN